MLKTFAIFNPGRCRNSRDQRWSRLTRDRWSIASRIGTVETENRAAGKPDLIEGLQDISSTARQIFKWRSTGLARIQDCRRSVATGISHSLKELASNFLSSSQHRLLYVLWQSVPPAVRGKRASSKDCWDIRLPGDKFLNGARTSWQFFQGGAKEGVGQRSNYPKKGRTRVRNT